MARRAGCSQPTATLFVRPIAASGAELRTVEPTPPLRAAELACSR